MARIASWGLDIAQAGPTGVTLVVGAESRAAGSIYRALARLPGVEVLSEDVEELFERFKNRENSGAYHTYEEAIAELQQMGDTDDYLYGATGALSYTIEVGSSFIPSESEIPTICDANVKAARYFLENAQDPFPIMRHPPRVRQGRAPGLSRPCAMPPTTPTST